MLFKIYIFLDAMSLVHLELMAPNANPLVNVKMEDLVIRSQGNAIAQKDGRWVDHFLLKICSQSYKKYVLNFQMVPFFKVMYL